MEKHLEMILSYLRKNPEAGDTLEGITRWWLEQERIEISVAKVADALENLIQKGVIRVKKFENGTVFYQINKEK